jgi:hypothetical protein
MLRKIKKKDRRSTKGLVSRNQTFKESLSFSGESVTTDEKQGIEEDDEKALIFLTVE